MNFVNSGKNFHYDSKSKQTLQYVTSKMWKWDIIQTVIKQIVNLIV